MAVVLVQEQYERSGTFNQLWQRTYERTFIVVTDNPLDEVQAVVNGLAAVGIAIGNFYQTPSGAKDFGSFVENLHPTCVSNDGKQWIVTVNYGPYSANNNPKDPTQWIPKVSWGGAQFQKDAPFNDVNGKFLANSAGSPFNPYPPIDDSRPQLTIVMNSLTYDESWAGTYRDTINESTFWGYGPKCAKCQEISANRIFNKDIGYYWEITFAFQFNDKTWTRKILDSGVQQIDPTDATKLIAIKTRDGYPTPDPLPLDGSGKALALGGTPVQLEFEDYEAKDFSALGLDSLYQLVTNYVYTPPSI